MNKYNVRAIRKELDDCVRHNAWKKFRSTLTELRSKPDLFQAVVTSKTSKRDRGGSLLHALVKLNVNNLPLDLVTDMATAVPWILRTIDSRHQTPLHIALERQKSFPEEVIGHFLALNATCLGMTDRTGDTPLLKAAKGDCDIAYLKLLLRYDIPHQTTALMESKRKRRTPLWYIASNDLQFPYSDVVDDDEILPENLRLILLATYFALQRKLAHPMDEEEWNSYWEELNSNINDPPATSITRQKQHQYTSYQEHEREQQFALILRAFVSCIDLLGKYSVKMLDFFLHRETYLRFITTQVIDKTDGNHLLHQLCAMRHIKDTATSSILLEQLLLRHTSSSSGGLVASSTPNAQGNLPLHLAVANGHESFVSQLLPAFPDAVRHLNRAGELPLHIAMKRSDLLRAYKLWRAYPTAAEVLDGETRLYAFQLAARRVVYDVDVADLEEEHCGGDSNTNMTWLSFVYELLQAAPQMIGATGTL